MYYILKILIDIILFKAGPQDIPAATFLLKLMLLVYFLTGLLATLLNFNFFTAIEISIIDIFLLILAAVPLLKLQKLDNRILQTLTAIFGALGLFNLISLPFDIWYNLLLSGNYEQNLNQLPSLIMIFLSIWGLAILGHILHHALNINLILAAGISIFYMIFSIFLTSILFI